MGYGPARASTLRSCIVREVFPMSKLTAAPFVLIHGAWHGGWCWRKVTPRLRSAGHPVYAPSLTGLGDRSHLLHPDIDLSTHIADIDNLLYYEGLSDAIVVGHSYGGMVLSGLLERRPDDILHAVYLDAFLPEDGETIDGYLPHFRLAERARELGDGWRIPPIRYAADYAITDPEDAAWLDKRLGDQPFATFTQPIALTEVARAVPASYILTTERFAHYRERGRLRGFTCFEIPNAEHDAMVTQPEALADLLLHIAAGSEARVNPGQ